MVELAEIQFAYYMLAATGVLVAAIYYIISLRYNMKARETEIANILLVASEAQRDMVKDILAKAQPKIMECAEIEEKAFKLLASVA